VDVRIYCGTSGATVYYTTDGTTPTTSSPVYTAQIGLSGRGSKTVKTFAVKAGFNNSSVATAVFTIN